MRRKGIDFKLARHLTWRHFNAETDVDKCGGYDADYFARSPHGSYCVIVRVSDCTIDEDEGTGRRYLNRESVDNAPCIPFDAWSHANMVYGKWRRQTRGRWFWVQTKPNLTPAEYKAAEAAGDENPEGYVQKWHDVYWTCAVYWVEGGYVYHGTVRSYTDPHAEEEA